MICVTCQRALVKVPGAEKLVCPRCMKGQDVVLPQRFLKGAVQLG